MTSICDSSCSSFNHNACAESFNALGSEYAGKSFFDSSDSPCPQCINPDIIKEIARFLPNLDIESFAAQSSSVRIALTPLLDPIEKAWAAESWNRFTTATVAFFKQVASRAVPIAASAVATLLVAKVANQWTEIEEIEVLTTLALTIGIFAGAAEGLKEIPEICRSLTTKEKIQAIIGITGIVPVPFAIPEIRHALTAFHITMLLGAVIGCVFKFRAGWDHGTTRTSLGLGLFLAGLSLWTSEWVYSGSTIVKPN